MFKLPWARNLTSRQPRPAGTKRARRMAVEVLEDRCVPATYLVNSLADGAPAADGQLTLREAVIAATTNAASGDAAAGDAAALDTIQFAANTIDGTINLVAAQGSLNLTGGGALSIIGPIAGSPSLTVSGQNAIRVFNITAGTNAVSLANLTITQGNAGAGNDGGGVVNSGLATSLTNVAVTASTAGDDGGGIANTGNLTLTSVLVANNVATTDDGGGIQNTNIMTATTSRIVGNRCASAGAGIDTRNAGAVTSLIACTVADNHSDAFAGGLEVTEAGVLNINDSTISGNHAATQGGGGIQVFTGSLRLTNSTIVNNISDGGEGGGGISINAGAVAVTIVQATIVGNADTSNNPQGAGGISKGAGPTLNVFNSIISRNFAAPASVDDNVEAADITNGLATNLIGGDPRLGPLQDNGGPTFTMAPFANSPVIDAGTNANATDAATAAALTTDQRETGFGRIRDGNNDGTAIVDRGAVEFQFPTTTTALAIAPAFATIPFRRIVTLTATVTPTGSGTNNPPTGTVTFFNGTTSLGTATLNASGVATLTIPTPSSGAVAGTNPTAAAASPLPVGTNTIIARYGGDASYSPSAISQSQIVRAPTSTIGAYDPSTGTWSLRNSLTGGPADAGSFAFGGPGLLPIVGDWNGDGVFTVGVFNPVTATFMIRNSNSAGAPDFTFSFGPSNVAVPVAGDWDGDGRWGIGTFDPTAARWDLKNDLSAGLPDFTVIYGAVGSKPVVGDWNGDGTWTIGVVEPDGTWKLKNFNLSGPPDFTFAYGTPNFSKYVPGDWNGDGVYTPGVADPDSSGTLTWKLRNSNSGGPPDAATPFAFGTAASLPVAGDWNFPAAPLISAAGVGTGAEAIDAEQLSGIVTAALGRLQAAGVDPALLDGLATARVQLSALAGPYLGFTYGDVRQVLLDPDAAGHGWFVDPTPFADEEFDASGQALAGSAAAGRMDLLTAVLHELGHLAGLDDDSGSALMASLLGTGTRRTGALDAVFARGPVASLALD